MQSLSLRASSLPFLSRVLPAFQMRLGCHSLWFRRCRRSLRDRKQLSTRQQIPNATPEKKKIKTYFPYVFTETKTNPALCKGIRLNWYINNRRHFTPDGHCSTMKYPSLPLGINIKNKDSVFCIILLYSFYMCRKCPDNTLIIDIINSLLKTFNYYLIINL